MPKYYLPDEDPDDRPKADNGYHDNWNPPGRHGCTGGKAQPCDGYPLVGSTRCYFHTAPAIRGQIKRDKRKGEVVQIVEQSIFNNEDNADSPVEALMKELSRTQAIVRWLGDKLDAMAEANPEQFAQLITTEAEEGTRPLKFRSAVSYTNVLRRQMVRTEAGLSPWLAWFLREREHLVRITGLLVTLGIKLDQFELNRKQAEMLLDAMHYLAQGLGHDPAGVEVAQAIAQALEGAMIDDDTQRQGVMR